MAEEEPVRLVLTPEQREIVKRLSGQHVEAIELEPEAPASDEAPTDEPPKKGVLRFLWRLSAATRIPRQAWLSDEEEDQKAKPEGS
ncbi:MAG TPA: hypothetical protein VLB12_01190 [Gemmatimonadales bacterium]|nr:hypothetical protein [Gemmatimonadales bacterium]